MGNTNTEALHHYLVKHAETITSEWQMQQEAKHGSPYSLDASSEIKKQIADHYSQFILFITECLYDTSEETLKKLDDWTVVTAQYRLNSSSSIDGVIRSNKVFRRVIWKYVGLFAEEYGETNDLSIKDFLEWEKKINETLDFALEKFTYLYMDLLLDRLAAQASLIKDLSAPVIELTPEIGLLPIIGDIDTTRARGLLESTLNQSVEMGINILILDLSGVVMVDTMVAHEIFQLIDALRLIGTDTILTGIRPEVAQTSIQLGLTFDGIQIENSLKNVFASLSSRKMFY